MSFDSPWYGQVAWAPAEAGPICAPCMELMVPEEGQDHGSETHAG